MVSGKENKKRQRKGKIEKVGKKEGEKMRKK